MSSMNASFSKQELMTSSKLYMFPLALPILFAFTCFLTYTWAIMIGHVNPIFSFISDTGTVSPEMCVFGQFMHFICILYFGVVYIRYKQVELYYKLKYNQPGSKINFVAYIAGLLSILGVSVVANFQETNLLVVHVIGASLVFLCGTVWSCLQAYLSFKLLPDFSTRVIAYTRSVLSMITIVLCILFLITGTLSFFQYNGSLSGRDMLTWAKADRGTLRGIAVTIEWIMSSLFFGVFITTFIPEYRKLRFRGAEILFTTQTQECKTTEKLVVMPETNLTSEDYILSISTVDTIAE